MVGVYVDITEFEDIKGRSYRKGDMAMVRGEDGFIVVRMDEMEDGTFFSRKGDSLWPIPEHHIIALKL